MEYTIIFTFFISILSAFVITKGDSEAGGCVEVPDRLIQAVEKCLDTAVYGEEAVNSFIKDGNSMSAEGKQMALCMVTELGQFNDGKFDPELIEKYLREEVGSHPKLETFIQFTLASAKKANAMEVSDSEKAFAFVVMQRAKENLDLAREIYCQL